MQRKLGRLLILLTALVTLAVAVPAAAVGDQVGPGLGIRLLEAPVSLRNDPRARVYVVDAVKPGTSFSRRFEVTNGTTQPLKITLYPGAAAVDHGLWGVAAGHAQNELTDWITIRPGFVTVPPQGRVQATATFAVPRDASRGERYAALLAEAPPVRTGKGPAVASRIGIRVYLYVGPGGAPPADFVVDSLTPSRSAGGAPLVSAQVHNTGKRALDLSGELTLDGGPGGLSAKPFPVTLGTTLGVGDTEPVTVPLSSAITGGPWHARLTLRSGRVERQAEASITFPVSPGASGAPVKAKNVPLAKDSRVLVPLAGGLIVLLLVILFLLWLLARRRRRQPYAAPRGA